jgi:hypothetical protein
MSMIFPYILNISHHKFPQQIPMSSPVPGHLLLGEAVQQSILATAEEHRHEHLPGNKRREGLEFGKALFSMYMNHDMI